jgi:hypothetical protein
MWNGIKITKSYENINDRRRFALRNTQNHCDALPLTACTQKYNLRHTISKERFHTLTVCADVYSLNVEGNPYVRLLGPSAASWMYLLSSERLWQHARPWSWRDAATYYTNRQSSTLSPSGNPSLTHNAHKDDGTHITTIMILCGVKDTR